MGLFNGKSCRWYLRRHRYTGPPTTTSLDTAQGLKQLLVLSSNYAHIFSSSALEVTLVLTYELGMTGVGLHYFFTAATVIAARL